MQISADQASEAFNQLPAYLQYAEFSPEYVCADARRSKELQPCFYLYQEGKDVYFHGFHLSHIPNMDFYDIQSPYGYGGPIASFNSSDFINRAWVNYVEWCKKKRILVEFIRFHPVLRNDQWYMGEKFFNRHTVWVDLMNEDLLSSYSVRARTAIRKAWKNQLEVRWCSQEEFLPLFIPLYYETMRALQAEEFYFFSEEYFRAITAQNAYFTICYFEGDPVAGSIFLARQNNMEYHLSASTLQGKKMNAVNLILHEAATMGKTLGYKHLHLGGGTNAEEKNPLFFFKQGFSSCYGDFYIGKNIIFFDEYSRHWEVFKKENPETSNRVLFYRKW